MKLKKTVVINVAGLTPEILKHCRNLKKYAENGGIAAVRPVLPAVTCSVQATYLTGKYPKEHGIVGNGWYFRDLCEVKFWHQSNKLIRGEKIWDTARKLDGDFTCANIFWWFNMYSGVDFSVTPRPIYPADGRKIPDIYTRPTDIRDRLKKDLGEFPLFEFWGPNTSISSSRWIADCARWVEERYNPTLSLIYLPHLDYCIQKFGLDMDKIMKDIEEIDGLCGDMIDYYGQKNARMIILSEYGITNASKPIHINRLLRKNGLLVVKNELGRELLDAGASRAFAVCDHRIAHIYVNDPMALEKVRDIAKSLKDVDMVLDERGKKEFNIDHPRAGDLVLVAKSHAWFTYYYWMDDKTAPDFARTVDIHRKPGYDPAELFIDPKILFPKLRILSKLIMKKIGFRSLLDIVPLDASLVKGSHGDINYGKDGPLFITNKPELLDRNSLDATNVANMIIRHLSNP